jgi:diguanylate cyclase (GGDEF)-like protein
MIVKKLFQRFSILFSFAGILVGLLYLYQGYHSMKVRTGEEVVIDKSDKKHVLYISSYDDAFESVVDQLEGIKEVFRSRNIELSEEFMDTKNYSSREHILNFYNSLRFKLENHSKYDGVLIGDDAALLFIKEFGEELFDKNPIIFFGIDNPELAKQMAKIPCITGSIELVYIYDTLKEAISLFPKTERIVAVFDDTPTGLGNQKQLAEVEKKFPDYEFEHISSSKLSQRELIEAFENIGGNSIFLFLGFFDDADKNVYTLSSCAELIGRYAKVPIFTKQIMSVGNGPFAGKIIDYVNVGRQAAINMCSVLDGKVKIEDIPLYSPEKADFYFDYQQLKRFGIHRWQLPKDSIFVNKSENYFVRYKAVFLPSIVILFFLGILLIIVTSAYIDAKTFADSLEESKKTLEFSAGHDFLTGLPNRLLAKSQLEVLIKQKKPFALMMLDVDDFKSINDFFGHMCGDEVLKEIGRRLKQLEADGDFLSCRAGGDEFVLVYKGGKIEENDAKMYYIREVLNNPFVYDGKRIFIRLCIGLVNHDGNSEVSTTALVSHADVALYQAKTSGKNKFVFFTEEMNREITREKQVAMELENACITDSFAVMYQPQIDADSGDVQGYEALARLPTLNLPPQVFIPIAEKNALMVQIGRIITRKVIEQMAAWKEEGTPLRRVAINYSSGQVADTDYVSYLKSLLDTYDISSEYIAIEVTESLFMSNIQYARELFNSLAQIGVSLTLDDFGTGYSSLSYLTYLPVDTVKIDKSWIDSYLHEGKDSFIKNIVSLVHSLNMKLTVEGVEEKWQYDKLKEFQCDSVQGYYFSKPVFANDIV